MKVIYCSECSNKLEDSENVCSDCGYPEKMPKEERDKYWKRLNSKKALLSYSEKDVKRARILIFILSILSLGYGYFLLSSESLPPYGASEELISKIEFADFINGIIELFLGLTFLFCGFVFYKKMKLAILIPILLWLFYQVFITGYHYSIMSSYFSSFWEFLYYSINGIRGFVLKVLILGTLIKGFVSVKEYLSIKEEIRKLKSEN